MNNFIQCSHCQAVQPFRLALFLIKALSKQSEEECNASPIRLLICVVYPGTYQLIRQIHLVIILIVNLVAMLTCARKIQMPLLSWTRKEKQSYYISSFNSVRQMPRNTTAGQENICTLKFTSVGLKQNET